MSFKSDIVLLFTFKKLEFIEKQEQTVLITKLFF